MTKKIVTPSPAYFEYQCGHYIDLGSNGIVFGGCLKPAPLLAAYFVPSPHPEGGDDPESVYACSVACMNDLIDALREHHHRDGHHDFPAAIVNAHGMLEKEIFKILAKKQKPHAKMFDNVSWGRLRSVDRVWEREKEMWDFS